MDQKYYQNIAKHFLNLAPAEISEDVLVFIRRSLLNYVGGSLYAAAHDCCRPLVNFFETLHPEPGRAAVWGDEKTYTPSVAAFCNAARLSTLELNDGTGASAHPGIYVWSAVFAGLQVYGGKTGDVLRAVLFGYETATRMAKLSVNRILELGLHNPGFVGGLGAASAMGLLRGLNLEQLENAFGMTASLTPLCPFVSFVEGADTKDFYGGWGTYLGVVAADAAANGLTGPKTILNGVKSLDSIFRGDAGAEIPLGDPYMITNLSVKQYPACFAVNPAVNALLELREKYSIQAENIESVVLDTYPYSYDLNQGISRNVNRTSGKLSLPFTAAVVLQDGKLSPDAFLESSFANKTYDELMGKVELKRHDEYGVGEKAVRGCIAQITMKDGSTYTTEYNATKNKIVWTDDMLRSRFLDQVKGTLPEGDDEQLYDLVMSLSEETSMTDIMGYLNRVKHL